VLHKVLLGKILLRSNPSILANKRCVSWVFWLMEIKRDLIKDRLRLQLLSKDLGSLRHLRSRRERWVKSSKPKVLSSRSIWVEVGLGRDHLLERKLYFVLAEGEIHGWILTIVLGMHGISHEVV